MHAAEVFIPITLFICLAVVIVFFFYLSHKNKVGLLDTVNRSVDKGNALTPEVLEKLSSSVPVRVRDLRRGIVFLSIACACICASFFIPDRDGVTGMRIFASFPLFIGAGFMLVWKMNRYKD